MLWTDDAKNLELNQQDHTSFIKVQFTRGGIQDLKKRGGGHQKATHFRDVFSFVMQ